MDFQHYTVDDFVMNNSFRQWVLQGKNTFWDNWLQQHPHKQAAAAEAKWIIQSRFFKEDILSQDQYTRISSRILQKVGEYETSQHNITPLWQRKWTRILLAACVALLLVTGAGMYIWLEYVNGTVTYTTRYGETRSLTLPDQSVAILNANSILKYRNNWQNSSQREVWLEGEAFFSVQKKQKANQGVKFIVHTDNVQIEVLGTEFTVSKRESNTRVILNTGKIKLAIPSQPAHSNIHMQPGDWVQYEALQNKLTRKIVNAQLYNSWIKKKWILENTSLQQVGERIQETFGLVIVLPDTRLARESMTGVIPIETLDETLEVLSATYNVKVDRTGDTLLITK